MKEQRVPHIVPDLVLEFSFFRSNKLAQAQLWNSSARNVSAAVAVRRNVEISDILYIGRVHFFISGQFSKDVFRSLKPPKKR